MGRLVKVLWGASAGGIVRVAEGHEQMAEELIAINLSVDPMKVFGTLESSTCS